MKEPPPPPIPEIHHINFSLLLPSRDRVQHLTDLIHNVAEFTTNLNNIEMLIAHDLDDAGTQALAQSMSMQYSWVHFHARERGANCSQDYFNWLWGLSRGKYLWVLNDDILIETKNWDNIMCDQFETFEPAHNDDILLGWVNDHHACDPSTYTEFPVISNAGATALGFVLSSGQSGYGADHYIHSVYRNIERVINTNVSILHFRPHDSTAHTHPWGNIRDETLDRFQADTNRLQVKLKKPTKNFSLILPSRYRPACLMGLINNVKEFTKDITGIEMLIGYDNDDEVTQIIAPKLHAAYPWVHFYMRERSTNCSRDYINWLWDRCCGRYIWILNDDINLETRNWDEIALEKINAFTPAKDDDILYGWINDHQAPGPERYSEFPMVSNAAAKALGFVLSPDQPGYDADSYIHSIYWEIKRVVDMKEILIRHYRPNDFVHENLPWVPFRSENNDNTNDIAKIRKGLT